MIYSTESNCSSFPNIHLIEQAAEDTQSKRLNSFRARVATREIVPGLAPEVAFAV